MSENPLMYPSLPEKQEGMIATLEPGKEQQSNAEKSLLFRNVSWVPETREASTHSVCSVPCTFSEF